MNTAHMLTDGLLAMTIAQAMREPPKHVSKHRQGVKAKRPAHLKPLVRLAVVDGGRIEIRDRVRVRNGNVITL